MSVSWTPKQQQVIDLRKRNILVSAAAGSGKTAVLVERIISLITDEKEPLDIDRLLVVTFTNAAASEMRERIGLAIEERLEREPENEHLQKQSALVHNAYITTIHSFCLRVIRNHFHEIDLDPAFRIGDEGELKLLRSDVLERLLEERFEQGSEEFFDFVECYSTGKSDKALEDLILQLYGFAMSYPWPKKWLSACLLAYRPEDKEAMEQAPWMKQALDNIRYTLSDLAEQADRLLALSLSGDGPYMYEEMLRAERDMLIKLLKSESYVDYWEGFQSISFGRLSSKKDDTVSAEKREIVKKQRDGLKKSLTGLKEKYFYETLDQIFLDIVNSGDSIEVLVELTASFMTAYQKAKAEKNLVDYNDLEHYALAVLARQTDEGWEPAPAAEEYREAFAEIMIDEYQDSNLVQEMLLQAVSRESCGGHNLFMVGDVKQSIYKFRLARPELFMEKYNTYSLLESERQRIDLDQNFRSRSQVLHGTNYIFHQIMARELGNIQYDKACALHPGAAFLPSEQEESYDTEVLLIDTDLEALSEDKAYTARELEAKAVAARIKELMGDKGLLVTDKKTGEYRPLRFKDIVILLRTVSGWADSFTSVLMAEGIPAHTGSQTGYFSTVEVTTLLALLRVIDNPMQDIPFTAVLSSPIGGLSGEDLARIKSAWREAPLYEGSRLYTLEGEEEELRQKLNVFFKQLESFRRAAVYTPIHELIWLILSKTGYGLYVEAMPGGEQRRANIDMLVEKAVIFEGTSYKGLFNFVRYIENLQKYDVDYGEAEILNEHDDTVRIMSIHKSKGLEFPVVFVSGMGKQFNQQDARAKLIMHPDLGIGADYIDPVGRVKAPTLIKRAMQRQIALENLGEELRVLYVAFTRAKEKLIITGTAGKLDKKLSGWVQAAGGKEKLPYGLLSESSHYIDWILPALIRHPDAGELGEVFGISFTPAGLPYETESRFRIRCMDAGDFVQQEILSQIADSFDKEELLNGLSDGETDPAFMGAIRKRLEFAYPYEAEKHIHTKMTVSELKKTGQHTDDEDISERLIADEVPVPLVPQFISKEKTVSPTDRGTAYHKALQFLSFERSRTREGIEGQLAELLSGNILPKEFAGIIDTGALLRFYQSQLGQRMRQAEEEGRLYKERQFVLGVEAKKAVKGAVSDEYILLQGIIDAYFEEDGGLVVVDYKTDWVKSGAELKRRYKVQLSEYRKALKMLTGMPVKESLLYSFCLNKAIVC